MSLLRGRVRLGIWPTPLQHVDGAAGVHVKREDLCGFAFGGSKIRALEPLLDQAVSSGAERIVLGGRRDSNWMALAAVAASRLGLECRCIVDPGPTTTLAMGIARRFGATIRIAPAPGAEAVNAAIAEVVAELGPSAFGIPRAGADATGVLGYRALVREVLDQLTNSAPVDIVVALGSGGMAAGLLLGLEEGRLDREVAVHAVPVSKATEQATHAVRRLLESARERDLTQADPDAALRRLRILPRTGRSTELAELAEAQSGTLLDPVFAGPAWNAFGAQSRDAARTVVLVASGGLPAVFDSVRDGDR
jgi:1-aminocyclopropane-1-carboxylate deaminase/D-cysteine desulfhydrase-like pyridoxal-dependent ACC family enzyme